MKIRLRNIKLEDLERYLYLNHSKRKFHELNWPYFKQKTEKELKNYVDLIKKELLKNKKNSFLFKKLRDCKKIN